MTKEFADVVVFKKINNDAHVSEVSRQSAYRARNKAKLIKNAQEILAEIGPSATIEQIAAQAEVSPTTIYKYFESKDELFIQALGELWHPWISWSFAQNTTTDLFEKAIEGVRRLFRVKETHPFFAQVIHNTFKEMPEFFIKADESTAKRVFSELASAGHISNENFELKFGLWTSMFSGLVTEVHVTETLSPEEADAGLKLALLIWGISKVKAEKLTSQAL
jgi:AcrR family transcriptional regulator